MKFIECLIRDYLVFFLNFELVMLGYLPVKAGITSFTSEDFKLQWPVWYETCFSMETFVPFFATLSMYLHRHVCSYKGCYWLFVHCVRGFFFMLSSFFFCICTLEMKYLIKLLCSNRIFLKKFV